MMNSSTGTIGIWNMCKAHIFLNTLFGTCGKQWVMKIAFCLPLLLVREFKFAILLRPQN